jgi:hypothetical protein
VDEFFVRNREKWVVEEEFVHVRPDLLLQPQSVLADVVDMERTRVDYGNAAGRVGRVERYEALVSGSEGGKTALEKVERWHYRFAFFHKVFLYLEELPEDEFVGENKKSVKK